MVDNHEAVEVGDIEKKLVSQPVVKPKFTTQFPEAVVREGADEVTLREEEEGILHRYHECERQQMESWMWLGTQMSGHFRRRGGIRMGSHVLQKQGVATSNQIKEIWREQECQGALGVERGQGQGSGFLCSGQRATDPRAQVRRAV